MRFFCQIGGVEDRDEQGKAELGTFNFRNEPVPLVDLRKAFGLKMGSLPENMAVLVLSGEEGLWGALVGIVDGVFPVGSFMTRDLPISLICSGQKLYSQLDLWRGEPLVCLEPYKIDRLRTGGCL
jgi:chemotaxis signal transduction protein